MDGEITQTFQWKKEKQHILTCKKKFQKKLAKKCRKNQVSAFQKSMSNELPSWRTILSTVQIVQPCDNSSFICFVKQIIPCWAITFFGCFIVILNKIEIKFETCKKICLKSNTHRQKKWFAQNQLAKKFPMSLLQSWARQYQGDTVVN